MEKKITRRRFLIDTLGTTALFMMPGTVFGKVRKEEARGCFLYDAIYLEHDTGEIHPETLDRLIAISNAVMRAKWYDDLIRLKARAADPEIVSLVHDKKYIRTVKKECDEGRLTLSTSDLGDTAISKQSYLVALKAVGGVLRAVDTVIDGKAKNAFCAVRPPGHHARRKRGTGFCIFNNIAIAARYAQKKSWNKTCTYCGLGCSSR